ncbi:MAG: TolC family protein [Cyanobacteria bacterium P01_D01_bin.105]
MRYIQPAAFLLLLVGSSVPCLSRTATAAEMTPVQRQGADAISEEVNITHQSQLSAELTAVNRLISLGALLDSAQGETNRSLMTTAVAGPLLGSSRLRSHAMGTLIQSGAVEEWRRLAQAQPSAEVEESSEAEDSLPEDLPALEDTPSSESSEPVSESSEPVVDDNSGVSSEEAGEHTDVEALDSEAVEGSSEDDSVESIPENAELDAVPDVLTSDPNPLSVPVLREEVEIDRNPVVTLEEAVQLAYRNNQTLQASILQLEQAEAAVAEARAALLPSVAVQSTLSNQQSGTVDVTDLDTTLQLNYNLLTGGGRGASIRAAEIQQDVSALAVEIQQEQLRLVTANLYYALQEADEQIRINQSFVNEAERNLRDSELRQEVGVGTRFDVLRAEVQLANAQQALVQSQFNEDIARRDIARLLNLPPKAGLETTPVARAEDWPLDLEESILLAFQNRAELEQQLNQADLSEQQRQIALSAIRPQVSLFANYGLNLDIDVPGTDFGDLSDSSSVGLQLNWTLFNGGASRASARQQEIGAMIVEEQFSENLDQIRFDVEQAYFNIQANETNITTSNSAVVQAESALELANLRLQAGVGTQLDVLSAQTELTQAQVNNVTAILGYNRALVAIQRAISNLGL